MVNLEPAGIIGGAFLDVLVDELWDKAKRDDRAQERKRKLKLTVQTWMYNYLTQTYGAFSLDMKFNLVAFDNWFKRELDGKVAPCFGAETRKKRIQARRELTDEAYVIAEATGNEQKQAVRHYLEGLLQVTKIYFFKNPDTPRLANHIVDEVAELVDYQDSFAEMIDQIEPKALNQVPFHYLNPAIGFYGRERETQQLDAFLADDRQLSFSVVTGEGGTGKSKFVYSYVNSRIDPSWKAVYLSQPERKHMLDARDWKYPQKLLLIIDYAGQASEETGELLWEMSKRVTKGLQEKVRFLLIERQGISRSEDAATIWPDWYERLKGGSERKRGERNIALKGLLYPFAPENPFLDIPELSESVLRQLAEKYAEGKDKSISDDEWQAIYAHALKLEYRRSIKRSIIRPLIVLFITDAALDNRSFSHWNYNEVLEHVLKRYEKNWWQSLCDEDEALYESIRYLLLYATTVGGLSLEDDAIPDILRPHTDKLFEQDDVQDNGQECWKSLICGLNETAEYQGTVQPLEPDLIGEYFALGRLKALSLTTEGKQFILKLWENEGTLYFLNRCRQDFVGRETSFEPLFAQGAKALLPEEACRLHPLNSAHFLANLTSSQPLPAIIETVERLEALVADYKGDAEIALRYAWGLFDLSCEPGVVGRAVIVGQLEALAADYKGDAEIAEVCAQGLAILSSKQEVAGCTETVGRLEVLAADYEGNAGIALAFARGLYCLSRKQEVKESGVAVGQLGALAADYKGDAEIALWYAMGLVNLSNKQKVEAHAETVARLGVLATDYGGDAEIALQFAKGLFDLSRRQEVEAGAETVAQLGVLASNYEGNAEIAEAYAWGLAHLSSKQESEAGAETMEKFNAVIERYGNTPEFREFRELLFD